MAYNNRILVIDDDQAILDIFYSVLSNPYHSDQESNIAELSTLLTAKSTTEVNRKREFSVDVARQGKAGYEKIRAALAEGRPYSVVFTDMRMPPGWDGVETARNIRKIDPAVEIVVVTAFSDASISEIVKQVGFTDRLLYLKKPFDDEEILQLSDSLSMRWNLEEKVRSMVNAMEGVVASFFHLKVACYNEQDVYPLLRQTLDHISSFLDTPDVLLAKVENGGISYQIGLGRFSDEKSFDSELNQVLNEVAHSVPFKQLMHIDKYIVVPISCFKWQGFVVGFISEFEVEGTNQLLEILAKDMTRLFDMVTVMSGMRDEINAKDEELKELRDKVKQLEEQVKA